MTIRSAALGFALALGLSAGSLLTAAPAAATTGGCTVASFSASLYIDQFFSFEFSPNVPNCRKQCEELRSGCRAVAQASDKCIKGGGDGLLDADKVGCKDLDQPSENECKQSNNDEAKSFAEFLKNDLASALDSCEAAAGSCLSNCTLD
jgi:hypothetical protein